jgi:hypothetical protein
VAVGDSAYDCLWYERSTRFKRLLLMVLLRAQTPIHMNAGILWTTGYEHFTQVSINCIEYFTRCLRNKETRHFYILRFLEILKLVIFQKFSLKYISEVE